MPLSVPVELPLPVPYRQNGFGVTVRQYLGIIAGGHCISILAWYLRPWGRDVGSIGETWACRTFKLVPVWPVEGQVAGVVVFSWFLWCL